MAGQDRDRLNSLIRKVETQCISGQKLTMIKLEHIGIAVNNLEVSIPMFEKLLNTGCYKTELVESENVRTAFFQKRDIKIELLESSHPEGVIAKYIEKKGEGIHHLAFEVENIEIEIRRLEKDGFVFVNNVPKKGADNKLICFLHPKETNGVLIEICQEITSK
ncbi:MAG: methylmalonyl-CoA epimerase [Chitinophagaceae bacterium]|nr:methylmalonyl-CoA epimerase [Chitinophagaceae bacterium]